MMSGQGSSLRSLSMGSPPSHSSEPGTSAAAPCESSASPSMERSLASCPS
eukprot:CAMPEP_0173424964 /NCGR_PEP_ID=MMETSP1357-20121228/4777_1 /TAXON_ID=77926 /ORGANISM="Hemiselmis rufescens, Strain PCC563" /LENGTH=49 /DNA_ID= /DNA_START= /DNA_END= /DNA_ORIENTATION=